MIFLRAIPFSFSILWRYALVLPLLIAALFLFGLVAAIPMMILGFISPLIGLLMAMAFGVASSVVPIMVGCRVGLQSYNVRPINSYLGLMLPAIGYGLFEAVCMIVLLALSVGIFIVASGVDPSSLLTADRLEANALVAQMFEQSSVLTVVLAAIVILLSVALRSALLVPFSGASIGADPDGRKHTPFYGFGDGFGSMFALVIVSYIGTVLAVPLALLVASPFGVAEAIAVMPVEYADMLETSALAERFDRVDTTSYSDLSIVGAGGIIMVVAWFFFTLFAFSLQCAGAVLVFMGQRGVVAVQQRSVDADLDEINEKPMENTDMMALMRSRMPTGRNE